MPSKNERESGLSPEISRLSSQLAKDPKSKLFMPLAEEYMKAGMVEEAIMTLDSGLKANPHYMSARVLLGKAHLEKSNTDQAREQFEAVVKAIPDNLFALKKLGEIYRAQGRLPDAMKSFKMVTLLSPNDKEAVQAIKEMEEGKAPVKGPDTEMRLESHRAAPPPPAPPAAKPEEEKGSKVFDLSEAEEVSLVDTEVVEAEVEPEAEEVAPLMEQPVVMEMPVPETETLQQVRGKPKGGYALDLGKDAGLEDIFNSYRDAPVEDEAQTQVSLGVYEIPEDLTPVEVEGFKVEPPKPKAEEPSGKTSKEPFETETLAELYISQGFYDRAINIYKGLLMEAPGDARLRQKIEDLYLLAEVSSAKSAAGTREDAAEALQAYEPVDLDTPADEAEVFETLPMEDTGTVEVMGDASAGRAVKVDEGAVRRLEQFLDNIRRKGKR